MVFLGENRRFSANFSAARAKVSSLTNAGTVTPIHWSFGRSRFALLQGLLVCGQCGYSLYRTSTRTTTRQAKYYRCLGSDGYRHLKDPPCRCRPIRVEDLDQLVWGQVTSLLEKPELIRTELERRRQESLRSDPLEQRRGQLTQEVKRVEHQVDKLLDAYQEGLVTLGQLRQRMPELRRKQQTAAKELDAARWQALVAERTVQLEQSLETFVGRLRAAAQSLSVPERQKVVRLLIKEIVVEVDNRITIRHCLPLMGGVRNASGSKADCYPFWRGRLRKLRQLGLSGRLLKVAHSSKGAWRIASSPSMQTALSNSVLRRYGFWMPSDLASP